MAIAVGRAGVDSGYDGRVFLNVPFDSKYTPMFRALVFAVHDCGYLARCALEADDGSVVRVDKLHAIIETSRLGIHDISRTTLDAVNRLPRFDMPLEPGLFLGAKRFGSPAQKRKAILILDRDRFRYQKYCSDIARQDIRAHNNDTSRAIRAVRNWLQLALGERGTIPGADTIIQRYRLFMR